MNFETIAPCVGCLVESSFAILAINISTLSKDPWWYLALQLLSRVVLVVLRKTDFSTSDGIFFKLDSLVALVFEDEHLTGSS